MNAPNWEQQYFLVAELDDPLSWRGGLGLRRPDADLAEALARLSSAV